MAPLSGGNSVTTSEETGSATVAVLIIERPYARQPQEATLTGYAGDRRLEDSRLKTRTFSQVPPSKSEGIRSASISTSASVSTSVASQPDQAPKLAAGRNLLKILSILSKKRATVAATMSTSPTDDRDREPRIYVLPNLMTAGNLLCGFMAILHIVGRFQPDTGHQRYMWAIGFILVACLFDLLDGRLARLSGQSSDFGREFDSLADIVSFGMAPALLVHDIVLAEFEKTFGGLGWLIACIYLVCGAMRLARFNCLAAIETETGKKSSTSFRGCPIPAAAGVIVSLTMTLMWLDGMDREIGRWKYTLPALMLLLSYLMVSSLEYPSFKSINWRTRRSFHWVLISIIVLAFTVKAWQWMPTVLFVSYLLYGLVRPWISRKWRREIEDTSDGEIETEGEGNTFNSETEAVARVKSDK